MIDRNNKKIKEGDKVFFVLEGWVGVCIYINENTETARFKITENETGVGSIRTLNYIECHYHISVLNK